MFSARGDTDRSNLICMPRPLHFRRKQLSLGERAALLLKESNYGFGFVLFHKLFLIFTSYEGNITEETEVVRLKSIITGD